jgi:hypothetical protein
MLYRLVRPMRRKESSSPYFVQRIPSDLLEKARGLRLNVPLGDEVIPLTITPRAETVRLSLRTRDPSLAKVRHAQVAGYLENVWSALRTDTLVSLTHKSATALAGDVYRGHAGNHYAATVIEERGPFRRRGERAKWRPSSETSEELPGHAESVAATGQALVDRGDFEKDVGPVLDKILLAKGVGRLDPQARDFALAAAALALRDGFKSLERNATGDYSPDPTGNRFPEWLDGETPRGKSPGTSQEIGSLTRLVEDWWKESQAAGRTISTYESYRNTMARLVAFLEHDDASRVTAEDVISFKDFRLKEVNQRTELLPVSWTAR